MAYKTTAKNGITQITPPLSIAYARDTVTLSLPSLQSRFPQPLKEKWISEAVRIGTIIITFNLSKLWKAKFFILCGVILLVRLQEKFELDHSWQGSRVPVLTASSLGCGYCPVTNWSASRSVYYYPFNYNKAAIEYASKQYKYSHQVAKFLWLGTKWFQEMFLKAIQRPARTFLFLKKQQQTNDCASMRRQEGSDKYAT